MLGVYKELAKAKQSRGPRKRLWPVERGNLNPNRTILRAFPRRLFGNACSMSVPDEIDCIDPTTHINIPSLHRLVITSLFPYMCLYYRTQHSTSSPHPNPPSPTTFRSLKTANFLMPCLPLRNRRREIDISFLNSATHASHADAVNQPLPMIPRFKQLDLIGQMAFTRLDIHPNTDIRTYML